MAKQDLLNKIERLPLFERRKIYTVIQEGENVPDYEEQKDFRGVFEIGKNQATAVVSDKYTLVQLRDMFKEVLSRLPEEINGEVAYYRGKAITLIFPNGQDVGLRATNSVDASSALRVDFIAKADYGTVYIPTDVAGYKKLHKGDVLPEFKDFVGTIARMRSTWKEIVERLSKTTATEDDVAELKEIAGKRLEKHIDEVAAQQPTIWTLILEVIKSVASRKFKSEVNRQNKLRALSYALFSYALAP